MVSPIARSVPQGNGCQVIYDNSVGINALRTCLRHETSVPAFPDYQMPWSPASQFQRESTISWESGERAIVAVARESSSISLT